MSIVMEAKTEIYSDAFACSPVNNPPIIPATPQVTPAATVYMTPLISPRKLAGAD